MQNLQELYDFYLQTKPSRGKVKSATTLLIHICKALGVNSAEEISSGFYEDVPTAIEKYYENEPHKAIQDKSILAEMIGRFGPKNGFEKAFDILLSDRDENLRQFTLYSLEDRSCDAQELVTNYVERFRKSPDPLMRYVAAHLTSRMLCCEKNQFIKTQMASWSEDGDLSFIKEVSTCMVSFLERQARLSETSNCESAFNWLRSEFNIT